VGAKLTAGSIDLAYACISLGCCTVGKVAHDNKLAAAIAARPTPELASLGKLAISVSPSGLLFPYYLGVFRALQDLNCLEGTVIAGSSGGALIGAFVQSSLPMVEVEAQTKRLYGDVMALVSRGELLELLRQVLKEAHCQMMPTSRLQAGLPLLSLRFNHSSRDCCLMSLNPRTT